MQTNDSITLTRDVEAAMVPVGTKVTLQKGEQAFITQSLGGAYTVIVNGNMFRIEGKDADALGFEVAAKPAAGSAAPRHAAWVAENFTRSDSSFVTMAFLLTAPIVWSRNSLPTQGAPRWQGGNL